MKSKEFGTVRFWSYVAFIATLTLVTPPWAAAQELDRSGSNFDDLFENVVELTDEEVAAYGSRAPVFANIGTRFRPDLDFRDALDPALADEQPQWSQGFEELIVRDFFGDRKGGVFVDVGCHLSRRGSTTYYLEDRLEWTGLGIDAQRRFAPAWKKQRPNSIFISTAITDTDGETLTLYLAATTASLEKWAMEIFDPSPQETEVKTITLNALLEMHVVEKVDFLSIDIDGAEPSALNGFDIQRYKPDLCVVEAVKPALVKAYFSANGYELIERYSKVDKLNLYFRPRSVGNTRSR